MRRISTGVAVAVLALAAAVSSAHATTGPALRVDGIQPLVVRGVAFRPGERVSLTAMTLLGARQVVVRATRGGKLRRDLPAADAVLREPVRIPRRGSAREPRDAPRCRAAPACLLQSAETRRNGDGRGLPRPSRDAAVTSAGYFGGVTSTCMKPPGVRLLMRIDVPVCGLFTLLTSSDS